MLCAVPFLIVFFDNILKNSESTRRQNMARQSLSAKMIISRYSNTNSLNISLTPAPVLIPVQTRRNNESKAEQNNSFVNKDNSADNPEFEHYV